MNKEEYEGFKYGFIGILESILSAFLISFLTTITFMSIGFAIVVGVAFPFLTIYYGYMLLRHVVGI